MIIVLVDACPLILCHGCFHKNINYQVSQRIIKKYAFPTEQKLSDA
jgi:hypothetical protein